MLVVARAGVLGLQEDREEPSPSLDLLILQEILVEPILLELLTEKTGTDLRNITETFININIDSEYISQQ